MNSEAEAEPGRKQIILLIHGTFAGSRGIQTKKWWEQESNFASHLLADLGGSFEIDDTFLWGNGGANSEEARRHGAAELLDRMAELEKRSDCSGFHLVAHSHAGNLVAMSLRAASASRTTLTKFRTWTTVGTPFLAFSPAQLPLTRMILLITALAASPVVATVALGIYSEWAAIARDVGAWALWGVLALMGLIGLIIAGLLISVIFQLAVSARHRGTAGRLVRDPPLAESWLGIWHPDDEARALIAASLVRPPVLMPRLARPDSGLLQRLVGIVTGFDWLYAPAADQQAWSVVTGKVQGRDLGEDLTTVGPGPAELDAWWPMLPPSAVAQMSDYADRAAATALQTGRLQLRSVGMQDEVGEMGALFAGTATWQELIHTSYFDSRDVRSLIVSHIAGTPGILTDTLQQWYSQGRVPVARNQPRNRFLVQLPVVKAMLAAPILGLLFLSVWYAYGSFLRPHTSIGLKEQVASFLLNSPDLRLTSDGTTFSDIALRATTTTDLAEALRQAQKITLARARLEAVRSIASELGRQGSLAEVATIIATLDSDDAKVARDLKVQLSASVVEGALSAGNRDGQILLENLVENGEANFRGLYVRPLPSLMISSSRLGKGDLARVFLRAYVDATDRTCVDWPWMVGQLAEAGEGGLIDDFAAACFTKDLPKPLIYRRALSVVQAFLAQHEGQQDASILKFRNLAASLAPEAAKDPDIEHDPDPVGSIYSLLKAKKTEAGTLLALQWLPVMQASPKHSGLIPAIVDAIKPTNAVLADAILQGWRQGLHQLWHRSLADSVVDVDELTQVTHALLEFGDQAFVKNGTESLDASIDEIDPTEAPCAFLRSTTQAEAIKTAVATAEAHSKPVDTKVIDSSGDRVVRAARGLPMTSPAPNARREQCTQYGVAALELALRYDMTQQGEIAALVLGVTSVEPGAELRIRARAILARSQARTATALSGIEMAERIPDATLSLQALDDILSDRGIDR
ncbi:hypothetical protein NKH94_14870 [Mesorhizobium australicum]|uniref:hypothetical protein n=1 Tax=Mesorhizobium australicum TaxID=536018 RepID=UPI00333954A3